MSCLRVVVIAGLLITSCSDPATNQKKQTIAPVKPATMVKPLTEDELETREQTITLQYVAWSCTCANWVTPEEAEHSDVLLKNTIFIHPANTAIALPDTIGYNGDRVWFTGKFYNRKGYPPGYVQNEEEVAPARVFRYTDYKIIRSEHHRYREGRPLDYTGTVMVKGTITDFAPGYCGTICSGGMIRVQLSEQIPGYYNDGIYLVTACANGSLVGHKISVSATLLRTSDSACYYQSHVRLPGCSAQLYKLSEEESRKL